MNAKLIEEQYESFGISKEVYQFGAKIEKELMERFSSIDETAEYNQMKVIKAMQDNKVSAECFAMSNGYGYNILFSIFFFIPKAFISLIPDRFSVAVLFIVFVNFLLAIILP